MPGLILASPPASAWSYGGAILTFVFPMILFLAVAAVLYVLYTKPLQVPGSRNTAADDRSVSTTWSVAPAGAAQASSGQNASAAGGDGPKAGE